MCISIAGQNKKKKIFHLYPHLWPKSTLSYFDTNILLNIYANEFLANIKFRTCQQIFLLVTQPFKNQLD